jgi:hypothetical protein
MAPLASRIIAIARSSHSSVSRDPPARRNATSSTKPTPRRVGAICNQVRSSKPSGMVPLRGRDDLPAGCAVGATRKTDVSLSNSSVCRRQLPYLECEIIVSSPRDAQAPSTLMCTDAETGTVVRVGRVAGGSDSPIASDEVARIVGGAYRLASIAVDLELGSSGAAKQTRVEHPEDPPTSLAPQVSPSEYRAVTRARRHPRAATRHGGRQAPDLASRRPSLSGARRGSPWTAVRRE